MKPTYNLFSELSSHSVKPPIWSSYTAEALWDDDHISSNMLSFHLDPELVPASRPHAFIKKSTDWIISRFELSPGKAVADFGCGPGLYSSRFAASGASITGIDFSRRSIDYARKQSAESAREIDYICRNYLDFETEQKFDLITLIYCDFCALSPNQRSVLLQNFRKILTDNGRIFLDLFSSKAYEGRPEGSDYSENPAGGFWAPTEYLEFRHTWKYAEEKVILDKYDIIEPETSRQVYNWLQYFSQESLAREFAENGLKISEWYDDAAGSSFTGENGVMAIVVEKN